MHAMAHGAQLRASGFKCCHSRPAPQLLSPAHCRPRYTGARWCPDSARILAAAAAAGKDLHPHGVVEPAAQHLPAAASAQDAPEAASPAASIGPSISSVLLRGLAACAKALAVAACVSAVHGLLGAGSAHAAAVAAAGDAASGGNPLSTLLSFVLHLDHHMSGIIERHGTTTYAILWAIVFCETGLVLTPFLPGDSLLFAAGAFAGMGKLNVAYLMAVFLTSAILGDAVNYAVGSKLGSWALGKGIVKREYVDKTEKFYAKYGGKTVVLARFVPIVRTFAPFVAGVGNMPYGAFATYNVVGAILWAVLFVGAGFFFGNLPFVQKNFTLVVLAIVAVSVVPVIIEIMNARKEAAQGGQH